MKVFAVSPRLLLIVLNGCHRCAAHGLGTYILLYPVRTTPHRAVLKIDAIHFPYAGPRGVFSRAQSSPPQSRGIPPDRNGNATEQQGSLTRGSQRPASHTQGANKRKKSRNSPIAQIPTPGNRPTYRRDTEQRNNTPQRRGS